MEHIVSLVDLIFSYYCCHSLNQVNISCIFWIQSASIRLNWLSLECITNTSTLWIDKIHEQDWCQKYNSGAVHNLSGTQNIHMFAWIHCHSTIQVKGTSQTINTWWFYCKYYLICEDKHWQLVKIQGLSSNYGGVQRISLRILSIEIMGDLLWITILFGLLWNFCSCGKSSGTHSGSYSDSVMALNTFVKSLSWSTYEILRNHLVMEIIIIA